MVSSFESLNGTLLPAEVDGMTAAEPPIGLFAALTLDRSRVTLLQNELTCFRQENDGLPSARNYRDQYRCPIVADSGVFV